MKKISNLILLVLLFNISACQQTPSRTSDNLAEVNALLRTITIDALKNKEYAQAQRSINALIINIGSDSWDFIHSAIISLPEDRAFEIITNAMKNDTVKNSSQQMFGMAKIYIAFKKTDLALITINKAVKLNHNNLDARYFRARLLTISKDYDMAEKDFKFIIKKQPGNQNYTNQYASFLQETKQFDAAQKILARHTPTVDGIFKRIVFALQAKNEKLANNIYPTLKTIQVKNEEENHKYFFIAEAAYWLEKFDESEVYYRKVSGGEHYLDSREMLSHILFDDERYDAAIEILHQLQNAEESYAVKAYRLESQIIKKSGDTDGAIRTLSNSLEILPNNPKLLYDRAMLYESQSKADIANMDKVKKDLLQIIKDDPDNFEALNALGYSLADHDMELENAHEYIKKAIKLAPQNPAIIDSLGWVQYKLGNYTDAEANFKSAISKDIADPVLYIHLYKTLLKLNKNTEARQTLSTAKELFPDNLEISELSIKK